MRQRGEGVAVATRRVKSFKEYSILGLTKISAKKKSFSLAIGVRRAIVNLDKNCLGG